MHLLFAYHHLKKAEEDTWDTLGAHLGTVWDRDSLASLKTASSGAPKSKRVFVPLSLVISPELPEALLGRKPNVVGDQNETPSSNAGDGLYTEMALPENAEVVNMGELPQKDFFELVAKAGAGTNQ